MSLVDSIKEIVARTPRVPLGVWPTPFLPMNGLRRALCDEGAACPALWVKREDLTPLGAGGNKVRKLEYVLAKALAQGADVILNTGEVQSNQVVQTAAAAAHEGVPCELFLGRTDPPLSEDDQETGNILLCRILGARIHLVPPGEDRAAAMRARAEELKAAGRRPCIIPRGSSTPEGALGSLACFFELLDQAAARGFVPDAVVVTVGQRGHHRGLSGRGAGSGPRRRPRSDHLRLRQFRQGLSRACAGSHHGTCGGVLAFSEPARYLRRPTAASFL